MFRKNVHKVERVLRVVLGVALLAAYFALPDMSYRWALLIGVVPLATGLLGNCPLYSVLGISTCRTG